MRSLFSIIMGYLDDYMAGRLYGGLPLIVCKQILDNINSEIRKKTKLNQWKNTAEVTHWFTNIRHKQEHSFASFDIDSFYPSITETLLSKAISYAKNYTTISDRDIDIIMHCRKSLLFDNETAWT